jgi:hypothetical protein
VANVKTIDPFKLPGCVALMATAYFAQSPSEAVKMVGDQVTGSYRMMLLLTDTKKAYDG